MAFGKPGRPAEDRLLRQREIYQAIAPLVLEGGAQQLSMRRAAQVACLSVGGLYHYFPTKRDLVLHGAHPAAMARLCQDFHATFGHLATSAPERYLAACANQLVQAAFFVRPALFAALELGSATFVATLEAGMMTIVDESVRAFRVVAPDTREDELEALSRVLGRTCLGALLDRACTANDLHAELQAVVGRARLGPVRPGEQVASSRS